MDRWMEGRDVTGGRKEVMDGRTKGRKEGRKEVVEGRKEGSS